MENYQRAWLSGWPVDQLVAGMLFHSPGCNSVPFLIGDVTGTVIDPDQLQDSGATFPGGRLSTRLAVRLAGRSARGRHAVSLSRL